MSNYNDVRASLGAAIKTYSPALAVNTYDYVPRSITPPAVIVQPSPNRTIDYQVVQGRGVFAKWRFNVMIVIGQVSEEDAQKQAGDLVSPGSGLITALNNMTLTSGYAQVESGNIAQMMFDQGLYTYAELSVFILT